MSVHQTLNGSTHLDSRNSVLCKIETIVENLLLGIDETSTAELRLLNRTAATSAIFDDDTLHVIPRQSKTPKENILRFPGASILNSWRFAVLLRTLDIISLSLTSGKIITKRDIYYRDTQLFKKQAVVDRIVDDIARTLNVQRSELGIVAAQKGLACGTFCIHKIDGNITVVEGEIVLIPLFDTIRFIELIDADFILVIEKEAVFRGLCEQKFFNRTDIGRSILITGKGYPDLATRHLVSHLAAMYPSIPIYGVFDSDPHGVDIFCTYKYGSRAMAHEHSYLTATGMRWIGINLLDYQAGWARLSDLDRKKAIYDLGQAYMNTEGTEKYLRIELQRMLFLNKKSEMNIISAPSGGITNYLALLIGSFLNNS